MLGLTSVPWRGGGTLKGVGLGLGNTIAAQQGALKGVSLGLGKNTNYVQQDDARMKKIRSIVWQNVILFP